MLHKHFPILLNIKTQLPLKQRYLTHFVRGNYKGSNLRDVLSECFINRLQLFCGRPNSFMKTNSLFTFKKEPKAKRKFFSVLQLITF